MTAQDRRKLKILLICAREAHFSAERATREVYEQIETIAKHQQIDFDRPSAAENANTLEEAINCHIAYGEYNLDDLVDEIENAIEDIDPMEGGGV